MTARYDTANSELPALLPKPGARIAVAGGCGALGQRLVRAAIAGGLNVTVLDQTSSLTSQAPPPEAAVVAMDGTDAASVHDAFGRLVEMEDGLDHLFFLIGFSPVPPKLLKDIGPGDWDLVIAANLRAAQLVANGALPLLRKRPGASITLVSSALTYGVQKGYGPYIAAKAGLNGLMRALALENAPDVRVNAVAPSAMLTPFMGGGTGRGGQDVERQAWFDATAAAGAVPMGRLCEPADVVGPMLFLASDAARFITGQIIHVNGGRLTP